MRKSLFTLLMIASAVMVSNAQIAKPVSEDAKSSEKIIQNAPFSAEAVTESVQILWDGTKIVRKMSSKLFRDRDGRFRREDSKMQLGVPGQNVEIAGSIRIIDPVAGLKYELNIGKRTYERSDTKKKFEFIEDQKLNFRKEIDWSVKRELNINTQQIERQTRQKEKLAESQAKQKEKQAENQAKQKEKLAENQAKQKEKQAENRVKEVEEGIYQVESGVQQIDSVTRVEEGMQEIDKGIKRIEMATGQDAKLVLVHAPGDSKPPEKLFQYDDKKKPNSRTESLGVQTIEGVTVEGTRTTTTIPMGAIGNDRDINIVYEKWYSKELQMTVFSKHTDPRFGEQTYRLSNISRNNPPISLFTPPADYRDKDADKDKRVNKPRVGVNAKPPVKLAEPGSDSKPGMLPKLPESAKKAPKAPKVPKKADDKDKEPVI